MGQNGFGDDASGYAWWAAFLLEMLLTAIFLYVILAVTDSNNEHPALAPVAIGLALTAIHFVALNATGTSVNPARSIGPALFAGGDAIKDLWLFILAPLLGAAIAGTTYPLVFSQGNELVPGSGLKLSRPTAPGAASGYSPNQYQQQWNQGYPQQGGYQQPTQTWQQPQQPQQQWARPDPNAPQQGEAEAEDGRTQIRPPENPA
jgi:aquaporin Z